MAELTERQQGPQSWQQATALIVLAVAALILLGAMFIVLLLGADMAELLALARTYLFRNALKNTLLVTAVSVALGLLFTWLTVRVLGGSGRANHLLRWTLLLPLAMPAALAALTWRMALASTSVWLQQPVLALIITGMIAAWRALPFLVLLMLALPRRRRAWAGVAGIAAYAAMADVTTPLLLTGGQPFNATHTLASWTFQLATVNRMWQEAAAIIWLALLALPIAAILVALRQSPGGGRQNSDERSRLGHLLEVKVSWIALTLICLWLLLPLAFLLMGGIGWLRSFWPLVSATGYLRWWFNTLLWMAAVALIAVPTITTVSTWPGAGGERWRARLSQGAFTLALMAWPVAFVAMGWLADEHGVSGGWLMWLFFSAISICIGLWLAHVAQDRGKGDLRPQIAGMAVFYVVWHGFAEMSILGHTAMGKSVGPAIVANMGAPAMVSNTQLVAAILLTTLIAWLSIGGIIRTWQAVGKG